MIMYVVTFYIMSIATNTFTLLLKILDFCLSHPLVEILDLSHTLSSHSRNVGCDGRKEL